MSPLIEGILAGYGIAIPVGAIAVLIIGTAMRCGLLIGCLAGAGAATADLVYALLASLAGAAIGRLLTPFALPLRVLGGLVLIGLALWGLQQGLHGRRRPDSETGGCHPGRTYVQFVGLTIINPLTVVYFTALILGRDPLAARYVVADQALFVLGASLASLSWQIFLAVLGGFAGRRLSPRFRGAAIGVGNLVVLALGMRILVLAALDLAAA